MPKRHWGSDSQVKLIKSPCRQGRLCRLTELPSEVLCPDDDLVIERGQLAIRCSFLRQSIRLDAQNPHMKKSTPIVEGLD